MLSKCLLQICPSLSRSRYASSVGLLKSSQSAGFRRISFDVAKWSRIKRPVLKEQLAKLKQPESEILHTKDVIPVRPYSDLLKALGFTFAGGVFFFSYAACSEFEKTKKKMQNFFPDWATFDEFFRKDELKGIEDYFSDKLKNFKLSSGQSCAANIIGTCALVTLAWRVQPLQAFMWRYFSNSYASKSLCMPMLLSVFSHQNLLHLAVNMYVLWTFAPAAIHKFLGVDQFMAMYLTGGLVSSLASLMHKSATRSPVRALGASGAICAALIYTCMKMPEARLNVVFLPMFTFSAENAVYGIILFDLCGLIFKFRIFDHAAHLGGSLFGWFYAKYGEEWYCKHYRPFVFRTLNEAKP